MTDPFSFTKGGEPWRTQSWLAELLYARLDDTLGLAGTPLVTTSCAALVFIFLGLVAYRRSRSLVSVVVYLVATSLVFAAFINPRPVIFSFPLFAAVIVADEDRRLRWGLPLLMWIWASVHGSFFIGLAYLLLRGLGRGLRRRSALELAALSVPTLLTAHGVGTIEVLTSFLDNREAVQLMSEWQTPDLLSPPFLPILVGIFALIWLAEKRKLGTTDWLILIPFLVLAVSANRSVPPAWIGLAPILARIELPVRTGARGGPAALVLAVALLSAPLLMIRSGEAEVQLERFPLEASKHLTADRVFHSDATGGWLIYTQWPAREVYIDDRAELFGDQMKVFSEVRRGEAIWREEFARWEIGEALVSVDEPIAETLRSNGWVATYEDDDFVLLQEP